MTGRPSNERRSLWTLCENALAFGDDIEPDDVLALIVDPIELETM